MAVAKNLLLKLFGHMLLTQQNDRMPLKFIHSHHNLKSAWNYSQVLYAKAKMVKAFFR